MASYYEQLGLSPQASAAEIEAAIDTLYNQWRLGVTHPDSDVVDQANHNLRLLEKMRATLTDPAKRAAYDAGIGLDGVAGLADPSAVLGSMVPPKPKASAQPSDSASGSLWACPNCKTQNPEWTQYCLNCQTELVRQCPECGQMKSLVKTGVCGNCGLSFAAATERVRLRTEIQRLDREIARQGHEAEAIREQIPNLPPTNSRAWAVFLGLVVGIPMTFGLIVLVSDTLDGYWVQGLFMFLTAAFVGVCAALVLGLLRASDRRTNARLRLQAHELELQVQSKMAEIANLVQEKNDAINQREKLGRISSNKMNSTAHM